MFDNGVERLLVQLLRSLKDSLDLCSLLLLVFSATSDTAASGGGASSVALSISAEAATESPCVVSLFTLRSDALADPVGSAAVASVVPAAAQTPTAALGPQDVLGRRLCEQTKMRYWEGTLQEWHVSADIVDAAAAAAVVTGTLTA